MTVTDIRSLFRGRFGEDPALVAIAPGRVNLIGEHTDYNDGFVFPAAIDRTILVAASPVDGPSVLFSVQQGEGEPVDVTSAGPGDVKGWARFPAGMAWAMRQEGLKTPNVRAVVTSTIETSGISSSAALEMAFGVIYNQLGGGDATIPQLARAGKRCENGFIGVQSGIMDQMASGMGREGQALLMDTWLLAKGLDDAIEPYPLPEGISIVLCDTKVKHELSSSAYNVRVKECRSAKTAMGLATWRDASLGVVEAALRQGLLSPTLARRARHIVTENTRCRAFANALKAGATDALYSLMQASHESLRDDYEVSCSELDAMAAAAWAAPGCVGARMTGGGFGGACVALVHEESVEAFSDFVMNEYRRTTGIDGAVMALKAVDGARLLAS